MTLKKRGVKTGKCIHATSEEYGSSRVALDKQYYCFPADYAIKRREDGLIKIDDVVHDNLII
jgi:hypothetical protein